MKNKTKKRGGECSIFGKSKKKDKTNKLQQIVKDLPDGVTNQLIFLLSKDSNIITSKLGALNLEEVQEQYAKFDDVLMTEVRGQVTPEQKVLRFIEVRRKQLEEIKDPMIYSTQEKSLIEEELNKLYKIFNASTSANVTASANAKPANAKPANAKVTGIVQGKKQNMSLKNVSALISQKIPKLENAPKSKDASLITQPVEPKTEVISKDTLPLQRSQNV